MKHVKMLGVLVMASVSLMAFASSVSAAPVLTSPAGTEYTGEVHATLKSGTTTTFKAGIEETCTDTTVKGTVTTNNTTHAAGAASVITNGSAGTPCTKIIKTLKTGGLTIADNGRVIASENEFTVFDLGVSCVYGGSTGTAIGTLTGGTPATLVVNTSELPKIAGGFLCASTATWTASFVVTTPSTLLVT